MKELISSENHYYKDRETVSIFEGFFLSFCLNFPWAIIENHKRIEKNFEDILENFKNKIIVFGCIFFKAVYRLLICHHGVVDLTSDITNLTC